MYMTELKRKLGRPKGSLNKRTKDRIEKVEQIQRVSKLKEAREQHRIEAESRFERYIEIIQPRRVLGNIHRDVISWWTRQDALTHQFILLPIDHMKSALVVLRAAW